MSARLSDNSFPEHVAAVAVTPHDEYRAAVETCDHVGQIVQMILERCEWAERMMPSTSGRMALREIGGAVAGLHEVLQPLLLERVREIAERVGDRIVLDVLLGRGASEEVINRAD